MKILVFALASLCTTAVCFAQQQTPFDRLPPEKLDVTAPSARVIGMPGKMKPQPAVCRTLPASTVRQRIVDVAVQEWAFFGFTIVDQTVARAPPEQAPQRQSRPRRPWLNPEESARVADSIAGYWTVTPDGGWILSRQNVIWNGPSGVAARWRDPWSAAFISWVMCEAGLGEPALFKRAIAHHVYIDQAISARDEKAASAYTAYDIGDVPIEPGDLICSGRRPEYKSIADRRSDAGAGARTHCDIVVKIDAPNGRILTIGGNVRGSVSMKLMPAVLKQSDGGDVLHESVGRPRQGIFAHLKLNAASVEGDALEKSPTVEALSADGESLRVLNERMRGDDEKAASTKRPTLSLAGL